MNRKESEYRYKVSGPLHEVQGPGLDLGLNIAFIGLTNEIDEILAELDFEKLVI